MRIAAAGRPEPARHALIRRQAGVGIADRPARALDFAAGVYLGLIGGISLPALIARILSRLTARWPSARGLIWTLLFAAAGAAAAPQIAIEAPEPLRTLLVDFISLPPAAGEIDEAERIRLARTARKQAIDLLATEGYFEPTVEARTRADGRLQLTVTPGRRTQVRDVEIRFAGDIADGGEHHAERIAALRRAWSLSPGKPFRQADWDAAKQQLLQNLLANDFAAATIADSRAEIDPQTGTAALSVLYDSGPAFTIGALEVKGIERYDRRLIERYSTLRPGEPYSQERLLELQRTLQNTPYFASVFVDIVADPEHPSRVPVQVRVSEAKLKRLSLGLGYGSNTGPHAEIAFRHSNILDRGWLLSSGLRVDAIDQLLYADVNLPPNPGGYRDSFGVLAERNQNRGLTLGQLGFGLARTRQKGIIETKLSLNALREQRRVDQGEPSGNTALTLNWSWTRRDVDNVLDPRRGLLLNLQVGGASRALLSEQNFVRTLVRAQRYWPVFERDVATVRGEFGWTAARSRTGIPETFLFRAGGAQSVRGYGYQSIGVQEAGAIVGGRYLATLSAEYVRWFTPQWGGAVFYDLGKATDTATELFRPERGYGAGVRWRSPAGPLAFDLAYGARDRRLRPVFSIEIAF